MSNNINLCEILKDCPSGTKLYSPIFGTVEFSGLEGENDVALVRIATKTGHERVFPNGTYLEYYPDAECVLFPSKEQRDWNKWKCPKPKFDPKMLKTFDKILSRNFCDENWTCDFVSHLSEGKNLDGDIRIYVIGVGKTRRYSIPYNEETKHLVGTSDEAPEQYKYWED